MTDTERILIRALSRILDLLTHYDQKSPGFEHPDALLDNIETRALNALRRVDPDGSLRAEARREP